MTNLINFIFIGVVTMKKARSLGMAGASSSHTPTARGAISEGGQPTMEFDTVLSRGGESEAAAASSVPSSDSHPLESQAVPCTLPPPDAQAPDDDYAFDFDAIFAGVEEEHQPGEQERRRRRSWTVDVVGEYCKHVHFMHLIISL